MTINVNIHEAKTHLSRLLEQVASGERVIISKAGVPVADLVVHDHIAIEFGTMKHEISYDDADFEEVDQSIVALFEGSDAADDDVATTR